MYVSPHSSEGVRRRSWSGCLSVAVLLLLLSACGTMAPGPPPGAEEPEQPRAGEWSLHYSGDCAGREAEPLWIAKINETEIVFDDFRLLRNAEGDYIGSAVFFAPMPADGRDIPYEISYALTATDAGAFIGMETVVEGGGHGLGCPIELVPVDED